MIAWLSGSLASKKPTHAVIEAGGVGYLVNITISTFYALPDEGEKVSLHIHTKVSEDAIQLFGFPAMAEMEVFKKLISINKVGPKLAMSVLSGLPAKELVEATREKNTARFASIPGVGPKTASRIILELADKLEGLAEAGFEDMEAAGSGSSIENDAVEALVSLGYKQPEARKAVKSAHDSGVDEGLEGLIKGALSQMS